MKETTKSVIEVVDKLNDNLYEYLTKTLELDPQKVDESGFAFWFEGNDIIEVVKFNDQVIWCSEADDRNYDEESDTFEDLFDYCVRMFNIYAELLGKIRLGNISQAVKDDLTQAEPDKL